MASPDSSIQIRPATADDHLTVRSLFDMSMLEVPSLDAVTVLVATDEGRIVGAIAVLPSADAPAEIEAIAVRHRRRGQGIGRALVGAASDRWTPLVARFNEGVRPFYDALDFDIQKQADGRYRGRLH